MSKNKDSQFKMPISKIGELLVKEAGFTEGKYEVAVGFRFGVGIVGPTQDEALPGAIFGIQDIGLSKVSDEKTGPMIVDASQINPKKATRKIKAKTE